MTPQRAALALCMLCATHVHAGVIPHRHHFRKWSVQQEERSLDDTQVSMEEEGSELPSIAKPWIDLLGPEKYAEAMRNQEEYEKKTGIYVPPKGMSATQLFQKGCSYATKVDEGQFNQLWNSLERLRDNVSPQEFNEQSGGVWESTLAELELEVEYVGTGKPLYTNTREWKYNSSSMDLEKSTPKATPATTPNTGGNTFNDYMKKGFDLLGPDVPDYFSKTMDLCIQISFSPGPGVQMGVALHGGVTFDALANIEKGASSNANFDVSNPNDGSWTVSTGLALSISFSATKVLGINILLEGEFEMTYTKCNSPLHAFKSFFNNIAGDQIKENKEIQAQLVIAAEKNKQATQDLLRAANPKAKPPYLGGLNTEYIKYLAAPMTMSLAIKTIKQIQVDVCAMDALKDFTYAPQPCMLELEKMARTIDKLAVTVNYWTFYYIFGGKDLAGTAAKKSLFKKMLPQPIKTLKDQLKQFLMKQFEQDAAFQDDNQKDITKDLILPDACDTLAEKWQYYSSVKTMIPDSWKFQAFAKAIKKIRAKDTKLPVFEIKGKPITDWAGVQKWLEQQVTIDKNKKPTIDWGVEVKTFSSLVQGYNYPRTVCNLLKRWIGGHFSGGREYDMAVYDAGHFQPVDNYAVLCDDGLCYPAKDVPFFMGEDKQVYTVLLWKPVAQLFGRFFDELMQAAAFISKARYNRGLLDAKSYKLLLQQMQKIQDSVLFLQNAAEKALLWNPETDDDLAAETFDADDKAIIDRARAANAKAGKDKIADVKDGEERFKGDSVLTDMADFNDDDKNSQTNEDNMNENMAHRTKPGTYQPLKEGTASVFTAMCTQVTGPAKKTTAADLQQGSGPGEIEQTWFEYDGPSMTFGGEEMDMEELPGPLIDDYAMSAEDRAELHAAFERGGYAAVADLGKSTPKATPATTPKATPATTPKATPATTPKEPGGPSYQAVVGGTKKEDNGNLPLAPGVDPKNGVGVKSLDKQVSEAKMKMAQDKVKSPVGLFEIGAGDVFVSIWAQAGSMRKDLAKACAAVDKKLSDIAVVKDEMTCSKQCTVSAALTFTATISFQFPTWTSLKTALSMKCDSSNTETDMSGTGVYDICSPDTNPIQVHAGYQYAVEITPTWWSQNDEDGNGQIGLCLNQEQQTHKGEISVEGFMPIPSGPDFKNSALAGGLKTGGMEVKFLKPKLSFAYGRQHCTSTKGCIPSGEELEEIPPNKKIKYQPLDKRSWVKTLSFELDVWMQATGGSSGLTYAMTVYNLFATIVSTLVNAYSEAKAVADKEAKGEFKAGTNGKSWLKALVMALPAKLLSSIDGKEVTSSALQLAAKANNDKSRAAIDALGSGSCKEGKDPTTGCKVVKNPAACAKDKAKLKADILTRVGLNNAGFTVFTVGYDMEWTNQATGCNGNGLNCQEKKEEFEGHPFIKIMALDQTSAKAIPGGDVAGLQLKFTGTQGVELVLDKDTCPKMLKYVSDREAAAKKNPKLAAGLVSSTATKLFCTDFVSKTVNAMKTNFAAAQKTVTAGATVVPLPDAKTCGLPPDTLNAKAKSDVERDADMPSRDTLETPVAQLDVDVPSFDIKRTELMRAASKLEQDVDMYVTEMVL